MGFSLITISCVSCILLTFLVEPTIKHPIIQNFILILICICCLYMLFYGINLSVDWQSPIDKINIEKQGQTSYHRRGGIILLFIKFWPYILIGWASFFLYAFVPTLFIVVKGLFSTKE